MTILLPQHKRRLSVLAAAVYLHSTITSTSTEAYVTVINTSTSTTSTSHPIPLPIHAQQHTTALHYRSAADDHSHNTVWTAADTQHADSGNDQSSSFPSLYDPALGVSFVASSLSSSRLPPWLEIHVGATNEVARSYLQELQEALRNRHLSVQDREDVLRAVHVASKTDTAVLTGAAKFVLGILSNLEYLGRDTLVAAAFHYCGCVAVRMKFPDGLELVDAAERDIYLMSLADSGIEQFGTSVVKIALSAAKMKRAEVLASKTQGDMGKFCDLLVSVTEDWRALAIRSYACLFRLQGLEERLDRRNIDASEHVRVAKEALSVYACLSHRLGFYVLKSALEDTAFHILYPRQYEKVQKLIAVQREGLDAVFASVTRQVKDSLQQDETLMAHVESIHVTGRVKDPYSMWRKILKKRSNQVPDAIALRVILSAKKFSQNEDEEVTRARDRALCYYVQEKCMRAYSPTDDATRLKDYIRTPKKNGYQSLHYTADTRWHGENWPFEIQIRSAEMHQIAEHGIAAHWGYKRNESNLQKYSGSRMGKAYTHMYKNYSMSSNTIASDPFMFKSDMLSGEMKEKLAPYLEAMSEAHTDQTRDHVFVVLLENNPDDTADYIKSKGQILSLPAGACVVDALGVHSLSVKENDVLRNGESCTTMTQRLCNGDVLSIPLLRVATIFA